MGLYMLICVYFEYIILIMAVVHAEPVLYRAIALVVLALVAGFVALQTSKGKAFWSLLKEARIEIRKVVWPTRQETAQTTMIVVAVVLVMALILWGLDSLLGWIVSQFIG